MRGRPLKRLTVRFEKRWGEQAQFLVSVALGLSLALLLIHRFNAAVRPKLLMLAETQIRNQVTRTADEALLRAFGDGQLAYGELVLSGQSGEITTLTTDTVRLNLLRSSVMEDVVSRLETMDRRSLSVPLGALTGMDLLSAWGPRLPVRVLSVATAEGTYRNDFSAAGINQTLHRVLLDVTVTARLWLPGGIAEATVSTPVCVVETVIIGQVPQTYLNWNQ